MTNTSEKSTDDRPEGLDDGLSLTWVLTGVVMFATALGAPIALFNLPDEQEQLASTEPLAPATKSIATASRKANPAHAQDQTSDPLAALLAKGNIVPGVGIGPVQLDTPVDTVLASVDEPSRLSYALTPSGLQATHDIQGDDFRLTVVADPQRGLINEVTLSALDCAGLRNFQPRQNGLPETADGLSLGSHVSRVQTTLGVPDAETSDGGANQPEEHTYPGLQLSYCPQDMLVGGITIERLPPAPLIASTHAPEPKIDTPELPDILVASIPQEPPVAPRPRSSALAQPSAPQSSTPAQAPQEPLGPAQQPELANLPTKAPDVLLAMRGNAFTVGDAFSLGATKRNSRIFARAAAPASIVHAVVRASAADETDAEFEGVGDFLVSQAEAAELDMNLTPRARGQIQVRLQLLGHNPKGVDGIFGPNTREVISEVQASLGRPATGFLDGDLVALIEEKSDPAYVDWQKTERARVARAQARAVAQRQAAEEARRKATNVRIARIPSPRNAPECVRDSKGVVISNQSFSCDVTVLEESLNALFGWRS